jgi:hypothetical protein
MQAPAAAHAPAVGGWVGGGAPAERDTTEMRAVGAATGCAFSDLCLGGGGERPLSKAVLNAINALGFIGIFFF